MILHDSRYLNLIFTITLGYVCNEKIERRREPELNLWKWEPWYQWVDEMFGWEIEKLVHARVGLIKIFKKTGDWLK